MAVTDVGPGCVQADVFAGCVGHFITFVHVHTGQSAGVQPEACGTRAPLQEETKKKEFHTHSGRLNLDIQLINKDMKMFW